ncbi:MAG TPA: FtsX-like permease family protein, partial [Candidatus Bathyarchaeia archaeon]|nr:FtsX-like permease family protein [Candidatus Bathyarchaeia archaeon]
SEPWREVIGVVADVREDAIGREALPEIFVPYVQNPAFAMTFVLRTASNPETLGSAIRVAVQDVDKDQPVSQIATMDELFAKSLGPRRFRTLLLGLFAMLALMLATIGIYGVIAHSCAQRASEFGLRVALGAGRGEIIRLVMRQGLAVAALGVGSGLVCAFLVVRFVASLLYGVKPTDPITFIAVPVLLTGVALAASYIPARRAMRVDPMVALRYE